MFPQTTERGRGERKDFCGLICEEKSNAKNVMGGEFGGLPCRALCSASMTVSALKGTVHPKIKNEFIFSLVVSSLTWELFSFYRTTRSVDYLE